MRSPKRPLALSGLLALLLLAPQASAQRVSTGLQAFYTFEAGRGHQVIDRSRVGRPLNLVIENPNIVSWQSGGLVIRRPTRIQTPAPASRLITALKKSGTVTVEAWVRPANSSQDGPARIVTISGDVRRRNLTMGQDARQFQVRLKTTQTTVNGIPAVSTRPGTAVMALTHVVYTRQKNGTAQVYLNGKPAASRQIAGDMKNWDDRYRLLLGNEATGDRPWLGTLYLVAIYSRALNAKEIQQNFRAGAKAGARPAAELATVRRQRFFETRVAPLIAQHCLDCHDSASAKGQLDLSHKATAFAGGKSGKAFIPRRHADSLLYRRVASGQMPPGGKPLPPEDRAILAKWIDEGATWSGDLIDPIVYASRNSGTWIQRLTRNEYIETVRAATGVDIEADALKLLPEDIRADGFSNTAYNLGVDLKHIEAYSQLAERIVSRMDILKFTARFSRSRKLSTDATMRQLVESMGKWLLRGPLDEREITNYSGIATTVASAGGSFKEAASIIVEAMLQSPRFIYRIEQQRGDGQSWPVSDHELASRLSYIIWGGPPDRTLMSAADANQLGAPKRIATEAARMLKDPRAVRQSERFLSEWLDLDRLGNLKPNPKRFAGFNTRLAEDMRRESLAFFNDIAWKRNRPLSDLLSAQFTYATPELARHYGLKPLGPGLQRYDLSSVPSRGGLLTQGSALTIGGDDASMVTRGLFVLDDFLRGRVKDPPPGVDTTPVPLKPGLSQRVVSEKRLANMACAGCHKRFEPIAFALEQFDGVGRFQEKDRHGNAIRQDGSILLPGEARPRPYKTSAELMTLLAGSERVRETITWKFAQFAVGRPLGARDATTIRSVHQSAWKAGGRWTDLVTALVTSELITSTQTQSDPPSADADGTQQTNTDSR